MQKIFSLILICFFLPFYASSEETFLSLKKGKVNVRYGPSFESPIKYVYKKLNLPIKQIDEKENFRRIVDHKKNSGWIHRSQLKTSKSIITTETKILFKKPTKYSEPLAKIDRGRLLIIKECKNNWCNIRTENFSGWVEKKGFWGNAN